MPEAKGQPEPVQPASGDTSSELERSLEELHLEPVMEELDRQKADHVRGGVNGMMGSSTFSGVEKKPLF